MLEKQLHRKKKRAFIKLKGLWLLLTSLILAIILFTAWQFLHYKHLQHIKLVSRDTRISLDEFFYDLYKEIAPLTAYQENEETICSDKLIKEMQKIAFNHPKISGLYYRDPQNQLVCSTVKKFTQPPLSLKTTDSILLGPFKQNGMDQSYYILQKKLGSIYIGIYLLDKTIKEQLLKRDKHISIMFLQHFNKNQSQLINPFNKQIKTASDNEKSLGISNKLHSIDNIELIIQPKTSLTNKEFWLIEFILLIIILLFSIFIYLKLNKIINQRFSLQGLLQYALRNEQFYPVYQPIYSTKTKKYVGAEVLVRWRTDTDELIPPDAFIYEAELTRLIIPISILLIKKSLQESHRFLSAHPDFHMAFNLVSFHFTDNDFIEQFIELVEEYQVNPNQIILELTERHLIDLHQPQVNHKIKQLINKGYSLAIDDFGTGHASINYLRYIPFNYLKIDKIYIQSIGSGAVTETLVKTIIDMGEQLQLTIIAEGVETEEQLTYLKKKKINLIQGWYFCKTMSFKNMIEFLNRS